MLLAGSMIAAAGYLSAWALLWLCVRAGHRYGWLDPVAGHKRHREAVPYLGGVALAGAFGVSFGLAALAFPAALAGIAPAGWAVAAGAALYALLGFFDDVFSLGALPKLATELAIALVVLRFVPALRPVPFGFLPQSPLLAQAFPWVFPLAWFAFVTNGLNLIDGIDGLASLSSAFSGFSILVVAWPYGAIAPALFLAFLAPLAAFLSFNLPPARIFLGNSGSLLLGFLLASGSLLAMPMQNLGSRPLALLFIFSYPALDVSLAVVRRLRSRRPIFSPDTDHIHHRLARRLLGNGGKSLVPLCSYLLATQLIALALSRGLPSFLALTLGATFSGALLFLARDDTR